MLLLEPKTYYMRYYLNWMPDVNWVSYDIVYKNDVLEQQQQKKQTWWNVGYLVNPLQVWHLFDESVVKTYATALN